MHDTHGTQRTIIDILRKGNQELFHSSMIAWLLEPHAEHGLGAGFLDGFAALLHAKGAPELQVALDRELPIRVLTEQTAGTGRYDIVLDCAQLGKVVLENKTKSLGEDSQLRRYADRNKGVHVVALGLCEESFSRKQELRMVRYGEVRNILASVVDQADPEFGVLVRHYLAFLHRELHTLDLITDVYGSGQLERHAELSDRLALSQVHTENDRRFLDSVLLERFHRHLEDQVPTLAQLDWHVYKNDRSGVWMADYRTDYAALPRPYRFRPELRAIREDVPHAKFWIHLELWNGATGGKLDAQAGILQLRAGSEGDNRQVCDRVRDTVGIEGPEVFMNKPNPKSKSFGLIKSPIQRRELVFDALADRLVAFYERFGSFGP